MKKIISYILACIMVLSIMVVPSYDAYAANVTIGVSSSSVNIGDTVTVTVSVPSGITAKIDVYFPTDLFSFVSASGTTNVNGGTIATTLGAPFSSSVTIKLKAKTTGKAGIRADVIKAGDSNTGDSVAVNGASTNITIANKTVEEPNTGNTSTGNSGNGNTGTNQQPETQKSGDNSLSSLKISAGSLSPAFKYNVTKYTATVEHDVTKLVVSAKASNEKATIESVTGNGNVSLNVGENTIKVVVKAENGVQATYTIVVTRKEKEQTTTPSESQKPDNSENSEKPDEPQQNESSQNSEQPQETQEPPKQQTFEYNGQTLNIIEEIPTEAIPVDFVKENILIEGKETPGLRFSKGELQALYLANESGYGSFYVYDKAEESIYPLIKLTSEKKYVIVLRPNDGDVPNGFEPCTISIEGKGTVFGYRYKQEEQTESTQSKGLLGTETYFASEPKQSDFYLLYCVNSDGEYGWYQFDATEGTFQRYLGTIQTPGNSVDADATPEHKDNAELTALKKKQKVMFGIFGAVVVALLCIVIALTSSKRKLVQKYEKSYAYEDNQQEDDSRASQKVQFKKSERILSETSVGSSFEERIQTYEDSENEKEVSDVPKEVTEEQEAVLENSDEIEVEFFDMSEEIMEEVAVGLKDEVASFDVSETKEQELEDAEADNEIEIEFFDMSDNIIEKAQIQELEEQVTNADCEYPSYAEESKVQESEIESFEISEKIMQESATESIKDKERVAFFDSKESETLTESESDMEEEAKFKQNLEKQLAVADKKQETPSDLENDDDLEFIDL